MLNRRSFLLLAAGNIATRAWAAKRLSTGKLALYVSDGAELIHYDVDVTSALLTRRSSFTAPSAVQYAWAHTNQRCLYVACSDQISQHCLAALSIDSQTGELSKLGDFVPLDHRPIHITTDNPSGYVLVAFNDPSDVRVFKINADLSVGSQIPQPAVRDRGIFPHQVRVTPDNRHAILVTRGISAAAGKPEDPGALKIFDFNNGILSNESSIAPDHGYGFGPRHLDFHPTRPWVYVSLERESKLFVYRLEKGRITSDAIFKKETVANTAFLNNPRQLAGAIHVHPNGRFVYVANRNDGTIDFNGKKVLGSGENTVTVYAIDQVTGEPTAIQFMDTRKVYPRTFSFDPSARFMTVHHVLPANIRDGSGVRVEPAGITTFRIGEDGKLTYEHTYDLEVRENDQVFWGNMVQL